MLFNFPRTQGKLHDPIRGEQSMSGNKPLDGKIAIVTGASRGIGRAIALRLSQDGATLVLASRTAADLAKVADEIKSSGGKATSVAGDLRDPVVPSAVVQAALDAHGAIDIVVNNAGATKRGDFFELTDADWTDGFALKFMGAVRLTRAAWPHLKARRGTLLNIIGSGGRTPNADFAIGGSVNGACLSFTKAIADLGITDGVQVNAINPGRVKTDRLKTLLEDEAKQYGGDMNATMEAIARKSNIVRLGEPEDIANLAAFMVSPQSRYMQGAFIDLDGGQTKTI
jgi:NAD(P)-dependent dehydrogenase (short-subunit alcohol dehydrogenase family)